MPAWQHEKDSQCVCPTLGQRAIVCEVEHLFRFKGVDSRPAGPVASWSLGFLQVGHAGVPCSYTVRKPVKEPWHVWLADYSRSLG